MTKRLSSVNVPEAHGPQGKGRGYLDHHRRHAMGKAPEGADSQFCVGEGMILNDRGATTR